MQKQSVLSYDTILTGKLAIVAAGSISILCLLLNLLPVTLAYRVTMIQISLKRLKWRWTWTTE